MIVWMSVVLPNMKESGDGPLMFSKIQFLRRNKIKAMVRATGIRTSQVSGKVSDILEVDVVVQVRVERVVY